MKIHRYTWEDTLIEAESLGILPSGAVNMCLRLAKAINWEPKNGGPSELRWKNVEALESVNSSRATYFRYRPVLFETGFLTERNGNLIPLIPDLSQIETVESQIETNESHIETDESQTDNPYSEDLYSEETYSDDSYSEDAPVVASAPTVSSSFNFILRDDVEPSSNKRLHEPVYFIDLSGVTPCPESQIETDKPDGAIRRVDFESKSTFDGWLFYSPAAAQRARTAKSVPVGADW